MALLQYSIYQNKTGLEGYAGAYDFIESGLESLEAAAYSEAKDHHPNDDDQQDIEARGNYIHVFGEIHRVVKQKRISGSSSRR